MTDRSLSANGSTWRATGSCTRKTSAGESAGGCAFPKALAKEGYLFLAVYQKDKHWRFSTDPVRRVSLRGLADPLQQAELARDPAGAASDPWFDGKPFDYTLVGAPKKGTALADGEVL